MSSIDPSSQAQLDSILKKLGVNKQKDEAAGSKDSLGQAEFLQLMTTQLQNQDPFAPMENGDFIAQMAQFSTVTGITEMGSTLQGIADQLGEFRIATAANLLGSSVMIPGNAARAGENGEIHGMLDLPSASGITNLAFSNAEGKLLHSIELGSQPAGLVGRVLAALGELGRPARFFVSQHSAPRPPAGLAEHIRHRLMRLHDLIHSFQ